MRQQLRITDSQVDRAIHVVDTSGALPLLEEALDFAPQGRPRRLSLRTWLIGAILAVDATRSFKTTTIHQALTNMSVTNQWKLDVCYLDRHGNVRTITKSHCDYLAKTLAQRLADTDAAAAHFEVELTDAEKLRRRQLREDALDRLLDASKVTVHDGGWFAADGSSVWSFGSARCKPHDELDVRTREEVFDRLDERTRDEVADQASTNLGSPTSPSVAVDTTPSSEPARDQPDREHGEPTTLKQRRRSANPYDYDAAHGSKTAKQGGRESFYGYVLDALVRIAKPGGQAVPTVIERLRISPASTDVVQPTFALLDSLTQTGVTITDLCVDRHYSYKKVERWANQLQTRGINQHFNLRANEHGFRDVDGMKMVGGRVHCPATPDHLARIEPPAFGASPTEWEPFHRKIEERLSWAADRDQRPDLTGRTRVVCPALAGKRGCPLREGTVEVAKAAGLPIVTNPPELDTAPACCTNTSGKVIVRDPLLSKHDQPHYWGSRAWKRAYDQRTYVEGVFGSIKNPDTEGLRRGFTNFVGIPMNSLAITIAAVVANIRHQRKHWHDRTDAPDHPLLAQEPDDHGWQDLTAEERALLDQHHANKRSAA